MNLGSYHNVLRLLSNWMKDKILSSVSFWFICRSICGAVRVVSFREVEDRSCDMLSHGNNCGGTDGGERRGMEFVRCTVGCSKWRHGVGVGECCQFRRK